MKNPVFDIENWREIGATLARNKTRTFLTAFGIFWGTAMLSLLWGGAGGLKGMLMRNFNGIDTNLGAIFPGRTTMPYKGFNKGMQWNLNENDLADIRRMTPGIEFSSGVSQLSANLAYGTKNKRLQLSGVEPEFFDIQKPIVIKGRLLNETDEFNNRKVALIGKSVADEIFGDDDCLGKFVNIGNVYFQVVGVIAQANEANIGTRLDESALIPASVMRRAMNVRNNWGFFIFTAKKGIDPDDLKPNIIRAIRNNHPIHPDDEPAIRMMNMAEAFRMVDNLFLGVSLLALFVGAGTLIAGIIGVGNIMWIIVKERTQEIGIRRAIGAKPRDIVVQILSEGMVLTAIAGTAGICFATLVLTIVDKLTYDEWLGSAHFQLHFSHALTIMIVFLVLGTAAGLIPAIKAMKIKPIEAMRDK
ncbi:MAG: ABC transporter permease [Paramuribaculum sp.]|nr:ABC transporter permease [Paramuribaculum sp.]